MTQPEATDSLPPEDEAWATASHRHDELVAARAGPIWLGAEPTFTDRFSWLAEWQTEALGSDKKERGRRMIAALACAKPGCVVLRCRGRQYPNEPGPRWSFGIYGNRDGSPLWDGPPDPLLASSDEDDATGKSGTETTPRGATDVSAITNRHAAWFANLESLARKMGWDVRILEPPNDSLIRVLVAPRATSHDRASLDRDWRLDPRVLRPWLESLEANRAEPSDSLAEEGVFHLLAGPATSDDPRDASAWQVELPGIRSVSEFRQFLQLVASASRQAGIRDMILTGYPPPVDASVYWTTITPDPGVLEVNMAPASDLREFYFEQQRLHQAARGVGLETRQLLYNGQEMDTGGGQHITFGGPSPSASPFFRHPLLLPRLIAFLNRHPCLSYLFASRSVGSSGQSPRVDEVTSEALDGLSVALDLLALRIRQAPPGFLAESMADELWRSVSPFLTDRFGNTHRSEVNVEKLWSPDQGERGRWGLVELRAFRMLDSPEASTAVAMLLRSLLALLTKKPESLVLKPWGAELHDRYGLPFYLFRDLKQVLGQLEHGGLGLPPLARQQLEDDRYWRLASFTWQGVRVDLRRGIEFWPLIGDHSLQSMQYATFRQVDASTARLEVRVTFVEEAAAESAAQWQVGAEGYRWPLHVEREEGVTMLVGGLRYKAYEPQPTLFPLATARDPLHLEIRTPTGATRRFRLHGWRPGGGHYDGLPPDAEEAQRRTRERLVLDPEDPEDPEDPRMPLASPPDSALSPCCLDTRRLPS